MSIQTKAVLFPEANKIEMCELTLPEMGKKDILVKTLATAISPGTERWILRGKHQGVVFPCVPGYQRIGVVEDCGTEVSDLQIGDIVYAYGSDVSWKETEVKSMWGAHLGHSVGNAQTYKFLSSKPFSRFELEILLFTVLTGVANRGVRFCDPQPGEKAAIIGGGIIGIAAAQLINLIGAEAVIVEKNKEQINFIQSLGLKVIRSDDLEFATVLKSFAPGGLDVLYDTVGHPETTDKIVKLMKLQGTVLLQAQYFNKEMCAIDIDEIKNRELTIKTTISIDNKDFYETKDNILQRRLRVAPLITHSFSVDDILEGYALLNKGKSFNLGIVFHW